MRTERELLKTPVGSSDNLVLSQHRQQGTGDREDPLKVGRLLSFYLYNFYNQQCPLSGPLLITDILHNQAVIICNCSFSGDHLFSCDILNL